MRVRRNDANNDWTFGRGRASYAATSESVAQRVKTRLQSFFRDWFLDLDHGLPWFARLEKPADLPRIEADVRRCILETPGVETLLSFDMTLNPDTRHLVINVTVRDVYGEEMPIRASRQSSQ
ncbi:MAG: hypothetical protein KA735_04885 [Burkholderiaceae bacterium]|nr:hypothetical protein [Burkholderiaceae bacterium]